MPAACASRISRSCFILPLLPRHRSGHLSLQMVCRAAAIALLAAACAAPALALYDASDAVVQLTDKDFDKTTRSGVWLVEVYAPW